MFHRTIAFLLLFTWLHPSHQICQVIDKTVKVYFSEKSLYKYIVCKNMTDLDDFQKELKQFVNETVQYVEVVDNNIHEIREDMFVNFSFYQLRILQSNVQVLGKNAFTKANIQFLNLQNNQIRTFEENCLSSSYVHTLKLDNNSIVSLEAAIFKDLINLEVFTVQRNVITNIEPDAFKNWKKVEIVDLSFNKISVIYNNTFRALGSLRKIILNNNYLTQVNYLFKDSNKVLDSISIGSNYINSFNAELYPKSVGFLNISQNQITTFNISNLFNLHTVDLRSNSLTSISSESLRNLTSCETILLSDNFLGLSNFSETFRYLTPIKIINLNNNQIKKLPLNAFKSNEQLDEIYLSNNKLSEVDCMNFPESLKKLTATNNNIRNLTNVAKLNQLILLDLSYNNLEGISFNMFDGLHKLWYLYLQHNRITKIDLGSFRSLNTLLTLDLSHNNLPNLPTGVFIGLQLLRSMDLSYNHLTILDINIFHNTRDLVSLNLAYNQANNTNIQRIISHMTWLKSLNIQGNHWSCSSLISLIDGNKNLAIIKGSESNTTNVFGVACIDDPDERLGTKVYFKDNLESNIHEGHEQLSSQLSVGNTMIILIFLLMCLKFCLKHCTRIVINRPVGFTKNFSEQELNMI